MATPPPASSERVCDGPHEGVNDALEQVALLDHHAHPILPGTIDAPAMEALLTESDRPAAARASGWDCQLGYAVRRWCAPLLGLEPHASVDAYLERRLPITGERAAAVMLPAAGLSGMLLDTGFRPGQLLDVPSMGAIAGVPAWPIVRIESVAEDVARTGVSAAGYADAFRDALTSALRTAVGCKTVVAYRHGLDFDPDPPTDTEVADAAGAWLRTIDHAASVRLTDPVLLRFGIWTAVRSGRPLQVHVGFGDTDLELQRSDPALLTRFLGATASCCPVMLLHTYPFQRTAGYLAQMFEHVYLDVGLAVNHTGAASERVIAESLELAPFRKILYSSDAWGLPELYLLGSWLFRRGLSRVLGGWVAAGDWSLTDARRVIDGLGHGNATRVYRLEGLAP